MRRLYQIFQCDDGLIDLYCKDVRNGGYGYIDDTKNDGDQSTTYV